ncbi:HEAT repeat domain-containing protein [Armatimonas rosea]|uniref:HEAT repeat protein n=1 Tax=Armatimonas rosea TaxID=685828 RepID=A0A7W9W6U2_ARMRO|nr:HEAT repeat domain-containing protein [Armatimonas rosea]MBB6050521.1 HEAT repeat protein [Armatimonas rosea]
MASAKLTQLIYKLNHDEYRERCLAENELVTLGKEAVEALIMVVVHQLMLPALRAASALSRISDERGVLPVARLALRESAPIPQILDILAEWQWQELPKEWAAKELVRIAKRYKQSQMPSIIWEDFLPRVRTLSPGWTPPVIVVPAPVVVPTFEDMPDAIQALRSIHYGTRQAATATLIAIGEEAVPALMDLLDNGSTTLCYRAAEILGEIGDTRAIAPLIAIRKTRGQDIEQACNRALIKLAKQLPATATTEDIPLLIALIQRLRYDLSTHDVALSAAMALEHLARTRPTPSLRGALKWLKPVVVPLPPGFKSARLAIEEATEQWQDLPLVTSSPVALVTDLPLPADASPCLEESQ